MSSISGVGGAGAQVFAQIEKLNEVVAQASEKQINFATKVAKLAVQGNVEAQEQATTNALLNKLV